MIYLDIHVSAKIPFSTAPIKCLKIDGFVYHLTLQVSNKTGGLVVYVLAEINGVTTKMTDGIFFSVIAC